MAVSINLPREAEIELLSTESSSRSDQILNIPSRENIDNANLGTEYLSKSCAKPGYETLLDVDNKNDDVVKSFVSAIFYSIEHLEAGGIFISDVFQLEEKNRLDGFKHFLMNFEVWGSYYPLTKIQEGKMEDISHYHEAGYKKLRFFLKNIENCLEPYKNRRSPNRFLQEVIEDLEIVHSILNIFYANLTAKELNSPLDESVSPTEHDARLIDVKEALDKSAFLINTTTLGHLIPVTCGHNGYYRQFEVDAYNYHLEKWLLE